MRRYILGLLTLFFTTLTANELQPDLTVLIPMRDGKELTADLYFPSVDNLKECPCVLLRNPSGRKMEPWIQYAALAKEGYVVAVQDTRVAVDTEGKILPYTSDGWGDLQDGYDTVEWLAKSPFTNGKVGSVGFSAPGITQLLMAPSAPPSLKCQYVGVAAASIYDQAVFNGGQLLKNQVEGWLNWHRRSPEVLEFVTDQPFYNDFWQGLDSVKVAEKVKVPAIHYGGWFDPFLDGTINAFVSRQNHGGEGAKGKQKLLIGPWTHHWPLTQDLGDFQVPLAGQQPPVDLSAKRWFDHHLKGLDGAIAEEAPVTYFVMGPFDDHTVGHVWRTAEHWPIHNEESLLYLTADAGLSSSGDNHTAAFGYAYDPEDPSPTIGGRNLFLKSGPMDQRPVEERGDVLVFTSTPFDEELELTGHLKTELYFASDCHDTDVVVRLTDVYPDGRSILVADGICRLGYAKKQYGNVIGDTSSMPLPVSLDLGATSMVLAKGHSLRISVTSSNYPRFEKNLNLSSEQLKEGAESVIAHNTIYIGKRYPSKVILPVVRHGNTWVK